MMERCTRADHRRRIVALSGHVKADATDLANPLASSTDGSSTAVGVEGRRPPSGPYTPGVVAGGFLYIASSAGADADGVVPESFEDRVANCCETMRSVCEAAGLTLEHVCLLQVSLGEIGQYERALEVLATFWPSNPPTRTTLGNAMGEGFIGLSGIAIVDLHRKRVVTLPEDVFNNNGAFAPGVVAGDRLFIGGQLGRDPVRQLVPQTPDAQVTIALCASPLPHPPNDPKPLSCCVKSAV